MLLVYLASYILLIYNDNDWLYGFQMIALKSAAEKGDFDAFIQEENAARLFNSGAFALNKPLRKEVEAKYAEVSRSNDEGQPGIMMDKRRQLLTHRTAVLVPY